jgi:hypothetical protein
MMLSERMASSLIGSANADGSVRSAPSNAMVEASEEWRRWMRGSVHIS